MPLDLGVLDFSMVWDGLSPSQALAETRALAAHAERHGFTRYWLGEHHARRSAHASPEVLLATLAATTRTIRLGSAGILLSYYSPLKVAGTFRLLETLFPGRIDLGLARGATPDQVAQALLGARATPTAEGYAEKVAQVVALLDGETDLEPTPVTGPAPQIWSMAVGGRGVEVAAACGIGLSLGFFLKPSEEPAPELVVRYRAAFRPRAGRATPRVNLAVAGACAPSAREAVREAERFSAERPIGLFPTVVGDPVQCQAELARLAVRYGTRDVVFLDVARDIEHRMRSYRLLAESA